MHKVFGNRDFICVAKQKGRKMESKFMLCDASIGFGKSVLQERTMQVYKELGYKIIQIDIKGALEGAYCQFEPKDKFHLKMIKEQGESDLIKTYPVDIYHPMLLSDAKESEGIPNRKIPERKFYTIPLKDFDSIMIRYMLESESETETFKMFQNLIEKIDNKDNIYSFLDILRKSKTRKQVKKIKTEEDLFESAEGTQQSFDLIRRTLEKFKRYGFLTPNNYELNLDFNKIMKDKETITIFTTDMIEPDEEKVKGLCNLYIILKLYKYSLKHHQPVLLVVNDLSNICPSSPDKAQFVIAEKLSKILKIIRTFRVSIWGDTQQLNDVHPNLRGIFNSKVIGNLSDERDYDTLTKTRKMPKTWVDRLNSASKGEFLILEYMKDNHIMVTRFPTFMHKEESYDYEEIFSKEYPERMINYYPLVEEHKKIRDKWIEELKIQRQKEIDDEELNKSQLEKAKEKIGEMRTQLEEEKMKPKKVKQGKEEKKKLVILYYNQKNEDGTRKFDSDQKIADEILKNHQIKITKMHTGNLRKEYLKEQENINKEQQPI